MARGNGLDDLQRRIRAMGVEARREIGVALDQSAAEVVSVARTLAPSDDGDLKASIRQEPGEHELQRVVEAGGPTTTRPVREGKSPVYDYALAQEFGTAEQEPQPFFNPAWRLARRRAKNRISRAVRKAARAAGWSS